VADFYRDWLAVDARSGITLSLQHLHHTSSGVFQSLSRKDAKKTVV
jgi:hypothetical protein